MKSQIHIGKIHLTLEEGDRLSDLTSRVSLFTDLFGEAPVISIAGLWKLIDGTMKRFWVSPVQKIGATCLIIETIDRTHLDEPPWILEKPALMPDKVRIEDQPIGQDYGWIELNVPKKKETSNG